VAEAVIDVHVTEDSPFGLVAPKDEDSDEGYLFLLDTLILPTTYDATPLMIRGAMCFRRDGGPVHASCWKS
jgi:hypothetical protein